MGFSEAISTCYSKFLVFEGRASRSEFWYFRLFVVLANIILTILVKLFPLSGDVSGQALVIIMSIGALLLLVPDISVQVCRFHDRGFSGLWLLPTYLIIPGVAIIALYMSYTKGVSLSRTQAEAFTLLGGLWIASFLFNFIVSVLPGHKRANKYGADPLEANGSSITSKTPTAPIFKEQGYSESPQAEFRSNQPRDALAQGSAATHTERQNIVPLPLADADEASAILLKYNDEARAAYSKLNDYPIEWQNEYRQRLVENPAQDPEALAGLVILKFLGRPDLAWSTDIGDDIWDALETTRRRNKKALDEFTKVFSLLSHTMTPAVIARKVIENLRGTVRWTYLVADEYEVEQKVHYYTGGYYYVDGFSEFFPNIESVYEYLNTPKSKRIKPFLLNTIQKA